MAAVIPVVFATTSLLVSVGVAWLTLFRRGTIKMTRPAFAAFGYAEEPSGELCPKIMIQGLLYATGKRGIAIEALFVRLFDADIQKDFPVWGMSQQGHSRVGGLFVGETGVVAMHHFTAMSGDPPFRFIQVPYRIEILARLHTKRGLTIVQEFTLAIPVGVQVPRVASEQVWFEMAPSSGYYIARTSPNNPTELP